MNEDQFFAQYPKFPNIDELKNADILIMPLHEREWFTGDQTVFAELVFDKKNNCFFYSEKQQSIKVFRQLSAPDLGSVLLFGSIVISTISGSISIYQFLKDKIGRKDKFRMRHVIRKNNNYYEMNEFEGNIDDYKEAMQEVKSFLKTETYK